jgi:hypothetical protein
MHALGSATLLGLAELLCASIQKRSTTPNDGDARTRPSYSLMLHAALPISPGTPCLNLAFSSASLPVEAFRWKPFDGGCLWMANGLNVCFCRRLTGCARSQLLLRVSDAGRSQRCGLHGGRRPKAFNEGTRGKWQAVVPRARSAMEVCTRRSCVRATDADECVG